MVMIIKQNQNFSAVACIGSVLKGDLNDDGNLATGRYSAWEFHIQSLPDICKDINHRHCTASPGNTSGRFIPSECCQ